jgi:collagen type V/XI/XXIV/XXVII alpha
MGPSSHPPNLIEYIWPCGHHENVEVQKAPGISFVRGKFSLPVAKPPEDFTEEERTGVPGRRKCCRCWATCSLFKPHEECEECDHPFSECRTCVIVDSSGSREIATIERRPVGEFDQTPEFWRCNTCEHINPFDGEGPVNGFLAPKVSDYMEDMECKKCGGGFTEDSWVVSPFWVYLGTWNGKIVAEGGPWHWSVEWHRDHAGENHSKDDCYATRRNGRRRRENPCIDKHFASESSSKPKALAIPPILIVDTEHDIHSLPPPSAGLTPFPEDHGYDSERDTVPKFQEQTYLHPDDATLGTGGFTIGDYGDGEDEADFQDGQGERGLTVPDDDQTHDLGSYYDSPPADEEQLQDLRDIQTSPDPGDYEDGQAPVDQYYSEAEGSPEQDEPLPEPDQEEVEPPPDHREHAPPISHSFCRLTVSKKTVVSGTRPDPSTPTKMRLQPLPTTTNPAAWRWKTPNPSSQTPPWDPPTIPKMPSPLGICPTAILTPPLIPKMTP